MAKLLVCTQAGWMLIQVICRTALRLPTSLLEVHTVAHVVCALLMYAIWWHKPRQVVTPTVLRGEDMLPLAVYMYSAGRMSGQRPEGALGIFLNPKACAEGLGLFRRTRPRPVHPFALQPYLARKTNNSAFKWAFPGTRTASSRSRRSLSSAAFQVQETR